ncbi:MAG: DUF3604 domain-containing protein, partial [Kiritimatiellales bacterium]|nr:DUF3604 domain-containing protein [Kiritimatiellales bacterium]
MKEPIKLGNAKIEPNTAVEAGAYCSIKYTYTVAHPIDDTGHIKIVFRFAGDFGQPQFDQPGRPNFCKISTSGDCRIEPRWDPKGNIRPWGRTLFLKVMGGFLDKGDEVCVVFGDTSQGSPGWRMQTFCETSFEFKTMVDPIATYCFKELPRSPVLKIVPGKAVKHVLIAPSRVCCGKAFAYYSKKEDAWGNPIGTPEKIEHAGFTTPGIHRIKSGKTFSNPICALEAAELLNPYWADFHGQSEESIGSNTIEDYFNFARDKAFLDIAGHQANDFQVTDTFWEKIKAVSKKFTKPGRFIVFPGYEWSGNTPLGGDRNVYFLNEEGTISRSSNDLIPGQTSIHPVSPTALDLFKNLKQQSAASPFCFAHVGGRYADLSMHDHDIECAVEVHSAWGTFEWMLTDAFDKGYRVGICANSDGHKGRPGASYPGAGRFGSYGGLTCVMAEALTREGIYAAMKARHFYATTGHRCLLDVHMEDETGNRMMMGDVGRVGSSPRL